MTSSLERSTRNAARPTWGKSGYQGVYWHKRSKKWRWDVRWRGQRMSGSGFASAEAAAKAREKAIRQRWPDRVAMLK